LLRCSGIRVFSLSWFLSHREGRQMEHDEDEAQAKPDQHGALPDIHPFPTPHDGTAR